MIHLIDMSVSGWLSLMKRQKTVQSPLLMKRKRWLGKRKGEEGFLILDSWPDFTL